MSRICKNIDEFNKYLLTHLFLLFIGEIEENICNRLVKISEKILILHR